MQESHFTDAFLNGAGMAGNNGAKGPVEHTKIAVRITRRLKIALESAPKAFGGILGLTSLFSMATTVVGLVSWRDPQEEAVETG